MSKQPSFIVFMTDQHRADYLGCMGHPVLKTPNIDGIAAKGTVWDQFYVTSPVCMPNRASHKACPVGHADWAGHI
ncbi:MAG: sulfatase-like hydrolase/transferase, partial [Pseudomonadota bacterium]